MKLIVPNNHGYLDDKYTKHASDDNKLGKYPIVSFPIEFKDIPDNTKSLAWVLIDVDSIPVCGFAYIHWLGCNLSPNIGKVDENASQLSHDFIQGNNSTAGRFVNETNPIISQHYIGPTPPDKEHVYTLIGYALSDDLKLSSGYWLNEFLKVSKDLIIDKSILNLKVKA